MMNYSTQLCEQALIKYIVKVSTYSKYKVTNTDNRVNLTKFTATTSLLFQIG